MARLRHVKHVRSEHAAAGIAAVVVVGAVTLVPISVGAQTANEGADLAVMQKPVDKLPKQLQPTAIPVAGGTLATASAGPPPRRVKAGAAIAVPKVIAKPVDRSITPTGWLTPLTKYEFSARYGQPGSWQSGYHTGLDFVADEFSRLRTPAKAVVISAEEEGAYGNLVRLRISPNVEVWMAHLSEFMVAKGQRLHAGQTVGFVGMTGNTTGPHLHLEVRVKDEPVDPVPFFWPNGWAVELKNGPYTVQ